MVRRVGFTLGLCRDPFVHHFDTHPFAQGTPVPDRTTP
jgi:hypothetical protein